MLYCLAGYSYWELYREALLPGLPSRPEGAELLSRLHRAVSRLDRPQAEALAEVLARVPARVGAAAAANEAVAAAMAGLEAAMAVQSPAAAEEEAAAAEAEVPAAEEEEEAPGPAVAGRKRDVFHSKPSRKAALLANAAKAKPAAKAGAGRRGAAAGGAAAAQETPGTRLASWLQATLGAALAVPPTRAPGAAAATCRDVAALDCLSGSPREAVHRALTEPSVFLGLPPGVGFSSDTDDTCLAFQLLEQVGALPEDWL